MNIVDRVILAGFAAGIWVLVGVLIFLPTTSLSLSFEDCSVYVHSISGEVYVYDISGSEGYGEITSAQGYGDISC